MNALMSLRPPRDSCQRVLERHVRHGDLVDDRKIDIPAQN
jgi:hypothetical protein